MKGPIYQTTSHAIGDANFTFAKVAPTNGDFTTRKLTITTTADSVDVFFTEDEYHLFKAIAREY